MLKKTIIRGRGNSPLDFLYFGAVYFIMLTAMFGAAWNRIGMEYSIVSALVSALSEAALLTLPYIFLPRRW